MSFERVPPRSEVMGWSPQHLANFLRKMNLAGSDKVVVQFSINGARFVNMTENDVLKFPKLHAPMISKICSEMNKKDEKKGLFNKKTTTSKYQEPATPVEDVGWGEDEFESDDDYEDPDAEDGEEDEGSIGDYEFPTEEQEVEEAEENDYEPNPSESTEDFPQVVRPSLPIGEGEYIDNINKPRGVPPAVSPRPGAPSLLAPSPQMASLERQDPSPYRHKSPGRALVPSKPQPPMVERSKKPTRERGDNHSPTAQGLKVNTLEMPGTHSGRPRERSPKPPPWTKPSVSPGSSASLGINSSIKVPSSRFHPEARSETPSPVPASRHHTFPLQTKPIPPRPGIPNLQTRLTDSLPPNLPHGPFPPHVTKSVVNVSRSSSSLGRSPQPTPPHPGPMGPSQLGLQQRAKDLDPCWYVGQIPRSEADHCLKQERKDGSYLVRDSTKQQRDQPYTLMVLHQDKVYNIQIRLHNKQYLLGTGMNVHETFPTVRAMISHYAQTPLLLIDAKNRATSQQNHCLLSDPAGYRLT